MSSPFKAAVEAKAPDAMAAVLRPDVVFRSPAVYKPYQGREAALGVLRLVVEVFEDFRYTGQLRAGDEEVLVLGPGRRSRARGVDLVRYDDAGLVSELTVMVRPQSGLLALLEAMGARLAAVEARMNLFGWRLAPLRFVVDRLAMGRAATWACPGHGSRFETDGGVRSGPAKRMLGRGDVARDLRLALNVGYWPAGRPARVEEAVAEAERLGWTRSGRRRRTAPTS